MNFFQCQQSGRTYLTYAIRNSSNTFEKSQPRPLLGASIMTAIVQSWPLPEVILYLLTLAAVKSHIAIWSPSI